MNKPGCCIDGKCSEHTCMNLPEGVTCGDCIYSKVCFAMYGHKPTDTYCDWSPRRFVLKPAEGKRLST